MPAEEGVTEEVVAVVSGGEPPAPRSARDVPAGAPVVAADAGVEHARALGLAVSVAVGDFDSAAPEAIAAVEAAGARIVRHPADKDATDLELALDEAFALGARRIVVLAGSGGRLDHELATLLLLASPRYASVEVDAWVGPSRVHVVRGERELSGAAGELLTLLPVHGPAVGVTTEGLVYPLRGETLEAGSSRGMSNEFAAAEAGVTLRAGVLLAIRPAEEEAK
jgi:thiamine pyrophosphokinase